ncbi:universal stress protein, partial [Halomonas sp. BBD48]|nr:universal stress protein [Halomonas sp. BBD48]
SEGDLSGNIGLGSREHLLEELATLDEKRARVAQEQGRVMLEAARDRAVEDGIADPRTRQRNGELVETLSELEGEIRLLVLGKRGEAAHKASEHLGSNLERVVRALHRPILMVPDVFKAPERVMIAFDGSKTTCKGIETLAASPFLKGLSCHVVTVGAEVADVQAQLDWAVRLLEQAGVEAHGEIRAGEVESTLHAYQREHDIDLLVMGAYGHSRIRHLLVGSTTTDMLRSAEIPLLLLR